jgi:IS5 family transposase
MYPLQIWLNLMEEEAEEHTYDGYTMRKFMGLDFGEERRPVRRRRLTSGMCLSDTGYRKNI